MEPILPLEPAQLGQDFGLDDRFRIVGLELRREGMRLSLQPMPLAVLEALVERPGDAVSRVELQRRLWPGDRYGDLDHRLNNAVNRLRRALGDSGTCPRFIETLPGRGYRLIPEVRIVRPRGNGGPSAVGPDRPPDPAAHDGRRSIGGQRPRLPTVISTVALLVAVAALAVVLRLPSHPSEAERLARETFLEARPFLSRIQPESLDRGVELLETALRLDPDHVEARTALARARLFQGALGVLTPREAHELASESARRALETDPGSAAAWAVLAEARFRFGPDDDGVEALFLRGLEVGPREVVLHHWYGNWLASRGRDAEALEHLESARRLDPLDLHVASDLAYRLHESGRRVEAAGILEETLALDPGYSKAHFIAGLIQYERRRYEEATSSFERALELSSDVPKFLLAVGRIHAEHGDRDVARRMLARLRELARNRYVDPAWIDSLAAAADAGT